jgi:hypothetical protein
MASFSVRGKTITIIVLHPIEIFIDIDGGGSWGWGPRSRRWRRFGVSDILLVHLFFFVRVTKDDDVAIVGRPEDITVEVTKEFLGELHIT